MVAFLLAVVHHGTISATNADRVSLFNKYFHSVFTLSNYSLPPCNQLSESRPALSGVEVSELEVFKVLSALDPEKAMGIDGIGPRILRNCALALSPPLQHLFQISLYSAS